MFLLAQFTKASKTSFIKTVLSCGTIFGLTSEGFSVYSLGHFLSVCMHVSDLVFLTMDLRFHLPEHIMFNRD